MRQAGTWDPLKQCCNACTWTYLSSSNKVQRKQYGTKNSCVHGPWGQILNPKDTKRPKIQPPFLKSLEQKQRVGNKSRVLPPPPAHTTTGGVGTTPKPDPWVHSNHHTFGGTILTSPPPHCPPRGPLHKEPVNEGTCCSHSTLQQQGP